MAILATSTFSTIVNNNSIATFYLVFLYFDNKVIISFYITSKWFKSDLSKGSFNNYVAQI